MKKTFTLLTLCLMTVAARSQTAVPTTQPFSKIDVADLQLQVCDFEKGANAMVLFDKGDIYYDHNFNLSMERHKRIKIFNDNGKNNANIRIEYVTNNHSEYITGLQAQTINLVDGKPEIVKLDKKLIYTEIIDKSRSALVFSMPNVKVGSIIEYKYIWNTNYISNFPDWYFQDKIPTRYSELTTQIPDIMYFKVKNNISQPIVKRENSSEGRTMGTGTDALTYSLEKQVRGLANVHSLQDEPYMTATSDNLQSIIYHLTSIKQYGTTTKSFSDSWAKVGGILADDEDFGMQLKGKLKNEETIITKAKLLPGNDAKIAFIFNEVKSARKWDGVDRWYTNDGTYRAWEKKAGNSAEINLILYHLLKEADVKAYPMVVSTREHGKVAPYYTFLYQFNRAVVYVPVDDNHYYILDATNKYNIYNEIPDNLLNSDGLYIDKKGGKYDIIYIEKNNPVRQIVVVNADIKADGKMDGSVQIVDFSYNRINTISKYKTDGEKKYIDYLRGYNNNLKIAALKFDNMDVDTLPLKQTVNFNYDLTGSDDKYIYFDPNLFSLLRTNPFLNENRFTDIDFGYLKNYTITGNYTIPANYKTEGLPKNISMMMPDSSIIFKRIVASEDGRVSIRFNVNYKKAFYSKEDYPYFYEFYKKMFEMLNEPIILKKS